MTFKIDWEKAVTQHILPDGLIPKMVAQAGPDIKMKHYTLISGGCANINVRIDQVAGADPVLLRIYLRDQEAASREQKLAQRLCDTVPVPQIDKIARMGGYHYAIAKFLPGITLRALLLGNEAYDLSAIMFDVGDVLAKIAAHQFNRSGFFNQDLQVVKVWDQQNTIAFAQACLANKVVLLALPKTSIQCISDLLNSAGHLFPEGKDTNCVHGDFDPANILVDKVKGVWTISGILDWEFAFSGATLCDVASMLRYAHHMPKAYTTAFLAGLQASGFYLPKHWQLTVHMLNLVSLLDCLQRADAKNRPKQMADICVLIQFILDVLAKTV